MLPSTGVSAHCNRGELKILKQQQQQKKNQLSDREHLNLYTDPSHCEGGHSRWYGVL